MIKNINKSTILVASNCRDDNKLFTKVNELISNKFDDIKNKRISILYTPRMGFRNKTRSQLYIDTKEMIKKWKYKEKLLCEFDLIDCSKRINIERCKNKITAKTISKLSEKPQESLFNRATLLIQIQTNILNC